MTNNTCVCGHAKDFHDGKVGCAWIDETPEGLVGCPCTEYRPADGIKAANAVLNAAKGYPGLYIRPADQLVERASVQLRMKAGLFIFSQRGAVDLSDPDSSAIPLGTVQEWMTAFAEKEVQAERERIVDAMESMQWEEESPLWNDCIDRCIEIVRETK